MKKILSLFALAVMTLTAMATEFTVFDGTDMNEYIPFRATYFDWSPYCGQVIYPAAELTALQGKDITGITFYIANENGNAMNGGELSVYLCATENTAFPGFSPTLIPENNFTLVGATPMTTGETEIVFNFTEPYTYEGGNLALMVAVTQEGTYSGDNNYYGVNADVLGAAYGWTSVYTQSFYPKTTFTYEGGGEEPGNTVTTLAEANALDDNAEFTFGGDAVVTVCRNGYLFLRDESGCGMVYGVELGAFENGQVLNQGWSATKTSIVDGWVKHINPAGLSASGETNAQLAAAQKLTAFPDESMLNAYVVIENLAHSVIPARSFKLPDGRSIYKTEMLWAGDADATTSNYNVYGVICKDGDTFKINITSYETYVAPPAFLRGDVNDDGFVTITDVTALINYLLTDDATGINLDAADCNLNDSVNISDVTALINYLLTDAW